MLLRMRCSLKAPTYQKQMFSFCFCFLITAPPPDKRQTPGVVPIPGPLISGEGDLHLYIYI